MDYKKMKERLEDYNWDDGFELPQQIVSDSKCDLALALEVFYLADGDRFLLEYPNEPNGNSEWINFVKKLMKDIVDAKYPLTNNNFEIPLTKIQQVTFKNLGIPEVLIRDV